MKTNRFFIAALFIAAAVSCQKESFVGSENPRETESVILTTGEQTKTSLNGNDIHWTNDDVIAVFDNTNYKNTFNITDVAGSNAKFAGVVTAGTTQIYAVYPANLAGSANGSTINVTIPTDQTSKAGSFAEEHNISVAKAAKTPGVEAIQDVTFKNVCGLLKFTIPAYIEDATSVTLSVANRAIAGAATVDYSGEIPVLSVGTSGSNSITMTGSYPANSTFLFVLAPGEINGCTVTVATKKTNWTITKTSSFTLEAGRYKNLGVLELEQVSATKASAAHTYSGNTLTGTNVTVNLNIPDATRNYVTALNLSVKNAAGTEVRSLSKSSASATETLSASTSWPYLPQGTYTLSGTYTLADGAVKTIAPTTFSSPAPILSSGEPIFAVTSHAYSSYTKYLASGATAANAVTDDAICDITSASVTISDAILNNSNYSSIIGGYQYFIAEGDNDPVSITAKDVTGRSWGSHTVTATYTFDGVASSGSTVCHITGLPYKSGVPSNTGAHPWSTILENVKWNSSYVELEYAGGKSPTISTPIFHIPSDINVDVASRLTRNKYVFFGSIHGPYRIGRSMKDVSALSGTKEVTDCIVDTDVKSEGEYQGSANGVMTADYNRWYVQYAYWAAGPVSYLYYFNINYR